MRQPSTIAAWMVAVVYLAILMGLVRMALEPDANFALGFMLVMMHFVLVTGPVARLLVWSMERRSHPPGDRRSP